MKNRWLIGILAVFLLAALLLAACTEPEPEPAPAPAPAPGPGPAPAPAPEPAPEVRIVKFNYTMPPVSAVAVGYEWWADEFEKRTDGRYVVETYPLSSLVPDAGSLDAVKSGVAEIIMTSTGSKSTDFPLASVTGLPTLSFHRKGVAFEEFMASFEAIKEFYKIPEVGAEFKDYHLIKGVEIDPSYLITKSKEVFVPEDLKGLLVGGASGALADLMDAYEAAGVFQIPPQAYMNMDKGVTDAAFMTYAMIGPYKMFEICDYILKQTFNAGTLLVMTSHDWYGSLSPADQKIFDDTWDEAMVVCAQGMFDENNNSAPVIESSGITINTPTAEQSAAWVAACEKYAFPTWAKTAQGLGYSEEVTDKVLAAWIALRDKYTTQ